MNEFIIAISLIQWPVWFIVCLHFANKKHTVFDIMFSSLILTVLVDSMLYGIHMLLHL